MKPSGAVPTIIWLAAGVAALLFLKWRDAHIEAEAAALPALMLDSVPLFARTDSLPKPFTKFRAPLVLKRHHSEALVGKAPVRAEVGDSVAVTITAYCLRGTTRTGTNAELGVVAADPRVFPLNREIDVQIEGRLAGHFRVEDTGLLIKGRIVDLWMSDCAEARAFGRKQGLAVLSPKIRR